MPEKPNQTKPNGQMSEKWVGLFVSWLMDFNGISTHLGLFYA